MALTVLDKIFWFRAGLGAITGVASELFFGCRFSVALKACVSAAPDYETGILLGTVVFLASYYFLRRTWGKNFQKQDMTKLYTTGIGSYVMLFLFTWILLFTLGVSYLTL